MTSACYFDRSISREREAHAPPVVASLVRYCREADDRVQSAMIANDPRGVLWRLIDGSKPAAPCPEDSRAIFSFSSDRSRQGEERERISSCFPLARGRHNLPVPSFSFVSSSSILVVLFPKFTHASRPRHDRESLYLASSLFLSPISMCV